MANIIFDFDGTLADTLDVSIGIFEELVRGGEPLPAEEIERLRGMSMLRAAAELRIPPWKAPFLLMRGRAQMRRKMKGVQVFPGIPELVRDLHAAGHRLYILSSNSVQNIRPFLKREALNQEFIKLYGGAGVFGKARLLGRMVKRRHLRPIDCVYIGDEVRDIEAARKVGMSVISVTWGYNNEKVLREHNPDFVAGQAQDIQQIIGKLAKT